MNNLDAFKNELSTIDATLVKIDKILDSAQPNLPGKIRIKFWFSRGHDKPAEPFIVERTQVPTKIPLRITELNLARRAKSRGLFAKNYMSTYALLTLASELLTYRKRIKKLINEFENRARGTLNGNANRLHEAKKELLILDQKVYNNLLAHGKEGYYKPIGNPLLNIKK